MTKLASSLPKALEDDGLGSLNRRLLENPDQRHLVIAVVTCKSEQRDYEKGGGRIATAQVVQIEPVYDENDQGLVADVLQRASDKRNGRLPLPGVDLRTGEVR